MVAQYGNLRSTFADGSFSANELSKGARNIGDHEVTSGWRLSKDSSEWMRKSSSSIYFHIPSETLWKASSDEHKDFIRLDDHHRPLGIICSSSNVLKRTAELARGFGVLAPLKACFHAWKVVLTSQQFEDMQRDLKTCCETACEDAGRIPKPRLSSPQLKSWRDEAHKLTASGAEEGLLPLLTRLFSLTALWFLADPVAGVESDQSSLPSPSISSETGPTKVEAPEVVPFNSVSLAKYNLQPLQRSHTAHARLITSSGAMGTRRIGVKETHCHSALAAVHRERESSWRRHETKLTQDAPPRLLERSRSSFT